MTIDRDIKFYDTSSLLIAGEALFKADEPFIISSISLNELEKIKYSTNKDADIKYAARQMVKLLTEHTNKYTLVIHKKDTEYYITNKGFDITPDTQILSDAIWANNVTYIDRVIFVTNDLLLGRIASCFFGNEMIEQAVESQDEYTGYKEITVTESQLEDFYQDVSINIFNLEVNEYLLLRDSNGDVIDLRKWDGFAYQYLNYSDFNSNWLGKIRPYQNDPYQKMLFDSLSNNKITMIKGPAGSGKSIVSLGFLMSQLEKHHIDKIIVFCNTVATMNSAKLGYYPGTKDEKLLDSQIGNLLSSKLGGREGLERLIREDKIVLLPFADIRGYDTTGMRAGIYLSEAQNLDRSLIKLALQRIGEDCICVIDGDIASQVDLPQFSGANNGMRRVSKVFRGKNIYGEIELNSVYRSQIAAIAENI